MPTENFLFSNTQSRQMRNDFFHREYDYLLCQAHNLIFHSWLQGNDPSCLREFLLRILRRNSPSGSAGLQVSICIINISYRNLIASYLVLMDLVGFIVLLFCRYLIGIGVLVGTFCPCYLQTNLLRE